MPKKSTPKTKTNPNPKIEKPTVKKVDGRKNNGGARKNSGRKEFKPTAQDRKLAESLSGYGIPIKQIAVLIRDGISVDTLTKYFEKELVLGKARSNLKVVQTLYQKAIDGDLTAAIFLAKTQAGFTETKKHELGGTDGAPIAIATTLDVSKLPTSVLAEIMAAKDASE